MNICEAQFTSEVRTFPKSFLDTAPPQLTRKVKNWSENVIYAKALSFRRNDVRNVVD